MNWTRGLKPTINASEASMGRLTTESKPPHPLTPQIHQLPFNTFALQSSLILASCE